MIKSISTVKGAGYLSLTLFRVRRDAIDLPTGEFDSVFKIPDIYRECATYPESDPSKTAVIMAIPGTCNVGHPPKN